MEEPVSFDISPRQNPEAPAALEKRHAAHGIITENMRAYLKGAAPWLKFMGVLGFIGAGLMALWGVGSLALAPFMGSAWGEMGFTFGGLLGGGMALLYIGSGALMFFPALFTFRFGSKISYYLRTSAEHDLEAALKNNKSLWKFTGIITIVYLALMPVIIIVVAARALFMFI